MSSGWVSRFSLYVGVRSSQLTGRDGREQPGELGVLGPVALDEERAALRVEAEREQRRGHVARPRAQDVGIVRRRQGVVVDDAVDRLVLVLERDVVADRAEVVAEVGDARRLDAAEGPRAVAARRRDAAPGVGAVARRHRRRV